MLVRSPACRFRLPAAPLAPWPAVASAQRDAPVVLIRDAETETLLRTFANPLFRAAGRDLNLVRICVVCDAAINSFVGSGNRMFSNTGLPMTATSAPGIVGGRAEGIGNATRKANRKGF
jgi:predicted Zn-dependent protease